MLDKPFSIDQFINELAHFSAVSDGVTRFPLTKQAAQARQYIVKTMENIGLRVQVDHVGNVRGRLDGHFSDEKAVVLGSHFDSVHHAGKYDGVAGIACSLFAVDQLIRQNIQPEFPIEIIALEAEEGCEFKHPLLGSKAITGQLQVADLKTIYNTLGLDYYTQCQAQGLQPDLISTQLYNADNTQSFIELHIEQAATLAQQQIDVGIVTAISALYRVRLEFGGQTNHAGATPMGQRRDALVGASAWIQSIPQIIEEYGSASGSITCGRIVCSPNRANIIPGQVTLEIDIRDTSDQQIDHLLAGVVHYAQALSETHQLSIEHSILGNGQAVLMHESLKEQLHESCQRLNISHTQIHSGAGHDAGIFGLLVPTAMLFVPSIEGFSHNPQEYTPLHLLQQGAKVLTDFLCNYHLE